MVKVYDNIISVDFLKFDTEQDGFYLGLTDPFILLYLLGQF